MAKRLLWRYKRPAPIVASRPASFVASRPASIVASRPASIVAKRLASVVAVSAASLLGLASPAVADFGFRSFANTFINQDGSPDLQAGSHPWEMITSFALNETTNELGESVPDGNLKATRVRLPGGLCGAPGA